MKIRKQSLEKISEIFIKEKKEGTDIIFRNSFALACYLSLDGKEIAGKKLVKSIFDYIGWNENAEYFNDIIESLENYAIDYAKEILANTEINSLFKEID